MLRDLHAVPVPVLIPRGMFVFFGTTLADKGIGEGLAQLVTVLDRRGPEIGPIVPDGFGAAIIRQVSDGDEIRDAFVFGHGHRDALGVMDGAFFMRRILAVGRERLPGLAFKQIDPSAGEFASVIAGEAGEINTWFGVLHFSDLSLVGSFEPSILSKIDGCCKR